VDRLEPALRPKPRWRRVVGISGFIAWLVVTTLVAVTFMAEHWTSLPRPNTDDQQLHRGLDTLRTASMVGRWHAVHVLYAECRCSKRVLDHLLDTQRPTDLAETILLVVDDEREPTTLLERFRDTRFSYRIVNRTQLKDQFHIQAAPLLIVLDPADAISYSGGYSQRKADQQLRDLEIVAELRASRPADPLPIFGCGVSRELQQSLDPLGIKYSR
jgi:hypothetical protein